MPHRKNAKGDIGTAKKFSDSYDMDNIYLAEEGWVYRHFKNTERTLWWDEIIVAGQVKPDMSIHGVSNGPGVEQGSGRGVSEVILTNPLKLGTSTVPSFQQGDGVFDYRYSNHVGEDIDDDASIVLEDPVFDDDQSGGGADHGNPDGNIPGNPNPPTPGLKIGTIIISGPRTFNQNNPETYTWSVSGGDFVKEDLTHRWFIIDKSDAGSGMSGEARLTVNYAEQVAYVAGEAQGSIKVGIEVTAEGANNSPIVETYAVGVV